MTAWRKKKAGDDIALRLAAALADDCPDWDPASREHKDHLSEGVDAVMKWLAEHIVWDGAATWSNTVIQNTERVLEIDNPDIPNLIGWHFIEFLQHAAWQPDAPIPPAALRERLGPLTRSVWDQVDWFWNLVASQTTETPPIDDEKYANLKSAELRSLFRTSYRRMPDGRWVGISDAVQWELKNKLRPPDIMLER